MEQLQEEEDMVIDNRDVSIPLSAMDLPTAQLQFHDKCYRRQLERNKFWNRHLVLLSL